MSEDQGGCDHQPRQVALDGNARITSSERAVIAPREWAAGWVDASGSQGVQVGSGVQLQVNVFVQADAEAVRQLAVACQMLLAGRLADAEDRLCNAADQIHDVAAKTMIGLVLWQIGNERAALSVLTTALVIDAGYPDALRARGEIYADLGDARNAIIDLNRVSFADRPSALAARGLALAQLGDSRKAISDIHDAVANAPGDGFVLIRAARAIFLTGDTLSGREFARSAIDAINPSLTPVYRDLALRLSSVRH